VAVRKCRRKLIAEGTRGEDGAELIEERNRGERREVRSCGLQTEEPGKRFSDGEGQGQKAAR
jgi:hypothetical protein